MKYDDKPVISTPKHLKQTSSGSKWTNDFDYSIVAAVILDLVGVQLNIMMHVHLPLAFLSLMVA